MRLMMDKTADRLRFQAIGEQEMRTRRDLAACYRLVAMYGWDDLLATHISARLPDEDGRECFLINPVGLLFEEITATSLVKVNIDGEILQETPYTINRAGFVIHSAVHAARADARCVIHLHTLDGVAVSAMEDGLLPLNQSAIAISQLIAFHDYEGIAANEQERERLVADLGDKPLMLLRNHGTLAVGSTIPLAFLRIYQLEWSCSAQVRTLGLGRKLREASVESIGNTTAIMEAMNLEGYAGSLLWPALLRKLDRTNPGCAD